MVRSKETKNAVLVLTSVCLLISLVQSVALSAQQASLFLQAVGIRPECPLLARLAYSFFHASIFHCLINCWCLLTVVFYYELPLYTLIVAYITAVTFPVTTIATTPVASAAGLSTVGLSAVCFSMLGQASFCVRRKLYFHAWIAGFLVITSLLPFLCSLCGMTLAAPNTPLHLYCYVVGLLVGFLNSPVRHAH